MHEQSGGSYSVQDQKRKVSCGMKWRTVLFPVGVVALVISLSHCETLATLHHNVEQVQLKQEQDSDNWNLALIDTARNVDYLSDVEKNVILEVNKARSDPVKYADLYIKPTLSQYSGRTRYQGRTEILTKEGKAAVEECVRILANRKGVQVLVPSRALSLAARDHVADTGPKGIVGHDGSDHSTPVSRVSRYEPAITYIGENIDYGDSTAREITLSLLIDDGVPSRGHRENILRQEYNAIGVAVGYHSKYTQMCVEDFARIGR